jgi:hypothetical protein
LPGCTAIVYHPSTLRTLICPEASSIQNSVAAVFADGSTVCVRFPQALTGRKCHFEEKQQGVIINGDTGQPATPNDPCIERGVTIAYNAEVTDAARKDVIEFLGKLFNK